MARKKQVKACKSCGLTPLFWKSFEGSWVLADEHGLRHICPNARRRATSSTAEVTSEVTAAAEAIAESVAAALTANIEASQQAAMPAIPSHFATADIRRADYATTDGNAALYTLIRQYVAADVAAALSSAFASFTPAESTILPTPLQVVLPDTQTILATIATPHKQTADVLTLLSLGLAVLLVGPAGSGKTNAADDAAQALKLGPADDKHFYAMSVGAQTSKSDLLGYIDAHSKLVRTIFREAYEHGGVFLLDEVDAGNANVLTVLNAALANGYCSFPDGMVKRHANFRCVACANTWGNGASRQYVGRNQLDAATLDRFVKVAWEYDETLETALGVDRDWTRYVQSLRKAQASTGVRVIFSMRAVINGGKMLKAGIDRTKVKEFVLWSGVSTDDRSKLQAAVRY